MAYTFVSRDSCRLTPNMLYQINRLDADLYAAFRVHVVVSSGIRTYEEQKAIFLERYVTAGNINGRRVYDTRVWQGVTWYRISSAGTVAVPGTSNHEIQGTKAAVDIRDTGDDAGITVASSTRGRWIRANCSKYGMIASGDGFGEGWHFDMINIGDGVPESGGGSMEGSDKQNFLNSLGYNTGAPGWGPMCIAATKDFQSKVDLDPDGEFGPKTTAVAEIIKNGGNFTKRSVSDIQTALNAKSFPVGAVDGDWVNKTSLGTYRFQMANNLTRDAQYGAASDAVLFPVVTPPPAVVPGRNATSRPLKDIQTFLKVPATGVWDKATSDATLAFQQSLFIEPDYIWGVTCDGFAFPPANFGLGADYSFARPSIDMMKKRGVKFTPRYLWRPLYDDGKTNKGLSKVEYDELTAAGIAVPFIYEEDGKELLGGKDAGIRVANEAERYRNTQGLPVKPIYFNVDFNAPASDFPAIFEALKGIAEVIGLERVGLYAGYPVIKAAFDAGVIKWGMQTYAWSDGQWDNRAQLRQWSNGQWGNSVDFQWAMAAEYGQTPIVPKPETVEISQKFYDFLKLLPSEFRSLADDFEKGLV